MSPQSRDSEELLAANQSFYDAHEARDAEAMFHLWVDDEAVSCTHPGWATLLGASEVHASWRAILDGPGRNQFILTNVLARSDGDAGWVSCDENIVAPGGTTTVAAINCFARTPDGWRLTAHHGSPVFSQHPKD